MKRLIAFLKTTTLGGLFVVLPIAVVLLLSGKVVMGVHGVAQAVVGKIVGQDSEAAHFPVVFSVLIVIAISFAFGLAMISRRGQAVERILLFRVPGYAIARGIVRGFADAGREGAVRSGLLTIDPGIECFVLVIEDHGGDHLTVFLPGSPNPASGNVQIVRRDLVRILNVRITDIGSAIQQWGMGSQGVLAKHSATASSEQVLL